MKGKISIALAAAAGLLILVPLAIILIVLIIIIAIITGTASAILGGSDDEEDSKDSACFLNQYVVEMRCELGRDNKAIYRGIPIAASQKSAAHKANAVYYIDSCIVDSSDGVYCFQAQPKQL